MLLTLARHHWSYAAGFIATAVLDALLVWAAVRLVVSAPMRQLHSTDSDSSNAAVAAMMQQRGYKGCLTAFHLRRTSMYITSYNA
jgi:hypothetical protein